MGVYDQACRYCAKMDPRGFFQWLLPQNDRLVFSQWLDTRTIPFPGEPDRICDTVGGFASQGSELLLAGLVVEFQSEPEGDVLERLLEYAVRVRVVLRIMSTEDATATLEEIRNGSIGRCILPWIPLMKGGDTVEIVRQWKELADGEPDVRRRADYGGLALVFAELAGCHALWKEALEDWNMRESQQVLEWQREARQEGRQEGRLEMLLQLLQVQFGSTLPESLVAEIRSMEDEQTVSRWLEAALRSPTLEDFRTRVNGRN